MSTVYKVEGMSCGGCVRSVTSAIERLGLQVEVSLEEGVARVEGEHEAAQVREAIEAAGFEVGTPAE